MEIDPKAFLFLSCVNGALASFFAKERKKKPYAWFAIGFIFGLLGLFFLLYSTSKRKRERLPAPAGPVPAASPRPIAGMEKFWYYLDAENRQYGPMSFQALSTAAREGRVLPATYVWNEDFTDWKRFEEAVPLG